MEFLIDKEDIERMEQLEKMWMVFCKRTRKFYQVCKRKNKAAFSGMAAAS